MKCDYRLGLYEKSMPNKMTLKEKLICTKECGFDYMEISIDETNEKLNRLDMTIEERKSLVNDMFESGVYIRTMCLSGHRKYPLGSMNENIRNKGLEIMEKAIELANDLGIRIIQIAGYDVYYEEGNEKTRYLFFENLKKSVEIAAKYGITLAFETMETEFLNTVEKAMYYVNKINSPYLKVYPDCGNVTNALLNEEKSLSEDFKLGKGNISAVHLKETVPGKYREIPFGEGHVNFKEVISVSLELGVRMFTLEFWDVGYDNWKEIIKENKEFMDKIFRKCLC